MSKSGILWFVVLLLFIIVLASLLISGNIALYLAPRMVYIVWFGLIIFIILLFYQGFSISRELKSKEKKQSKPIKVYSIVFLIPIILFFTVTPNANTPQSLPNQNVSLLSGASKIENIDASSDLQIPNNDSEPPASGNEQNYDDLPDLSNIPASPEPSSSDLPLEVSQGEQEEKEEISVADMPACVLGEGTYDSDMINDSFLEYLYIPLDDWIGESISLYGFVYKDDTFPENSILVSRLMISCCVADGSVVGYHVKVENADDFSDDEWIQVTGTVDKIELEMYGEYYEFPILTDGMITICEAPPLEDAYVYP